MKLWVVEQFCLLWWWFVYMYICTRVFQSWLIVLRVNCMDQLSTTPHKHRGHHLICRHYGFIYGPRVYDIFNLSPVSQWGLISIRFMDLRELRSMWLERPCFQTGTSPSRRDPDMYIWGEPVWITILWLAPSIRYGKWFSVERLSTAFLTRRLIEKPTK